MQSKAAQYVCKTSQFTLAGTVSFGGRAVILVGHRLVT